jgi:ABC-type multidrug transport system permease subunit
MWRRILAILAARNREFYRDRAGLGWNILMPILIVLAFAFLFRGAPQEILKVGVLAPDGSLPGAQESPLLALPHVDFVPVASREAGLEKVRRHQLDLLVTRDDPPRYWVNVNAPKGVIAEQVLRGAHAGEDAAPRRETVTGDPLRYVDWVLPGILAMNIMFSSLWGVGWVIVRYRKNGVLRRLRATPLSAFEFLVAQVISRLGVVLSATVAVYLGAELFLDFVMLGSYATLALTYTVGALCLISIALVVAARLRTEEVADGVLNVLTWPMLLLSGVWFSMEGTNPLAQAFAQLLPLTHLVDAARSIMIDGAGLVDVAPQLGVLLAMSAVFLALASRLFRWE